MTRIGMGIVGTGFIGPHHIDAVRRLGFVDVVAVAEVNEELAREKATALGIPKAYGSYQALLDDPDVQVIHNTTPNYLHYPINAAIIAKGKHVVSDKPLALSASQARELRDAAAKAGVVNAVTFSYRGNPLVQQMRHAIARGAIGAPRVVFGHYLQDWLLKDTDYSWRLEPDKGGASSALGDIGSHWCDLAQHVTGLRITHVLGEISTVVPKRKRPKGRREAFAAAGADEDFDLVDITVEDFATVLVRFDGGARGTFTVGQVHAGHKNDCAIEVSGTTASLRWRQEQQNELWIGHRDKANELLPKDPGLLDPEARGYAHMPGGHQEGWPDAFANIMRDVYGFIAEGKDPHGPRPGAYASFEDGYRANAIVEAILESARKGAVWTKVTY
ncbi:MAG: Gfo/Idh/MocA family oxidoreductase [Acidobacteria bacterium]|nr:Gfo/Idh/MocA family oxidoreductase [Acidobacteriota bacterium]